MPFVLTLMFFNWLEEKFITIKNKEKLEDGEHLMLHRKYDEALTFFTEKVKKFPKSAKVHYYRAFCNFQLGNFYSALYDIEQSISFDNTVGDAYIIKGKILYKLEEYDHAFLEFDKADWHFRSENPTALKWRGIARYQLGQKNNAILDFERAVLLGDEDAAYILRTSFEYIDKI
ncbi:MAG: tetratricopeptide repeat protein [Flectobacillus sp.]|uniref:tetratricopeptide repeat protein n=1 Tax=Flectobacillus sp. TaxID=50419 RepID=UPI003B9CA9BE